MDDTNCADLYLPPPKFPDFEKIFSFTLQDEKTKKSHEERKTFYSTSNSNDTDCQTCGYAALYMGGIDAKLNDRRCDPDLTIEPKCTVLTTRSPTTIQQTTTPDNSAVFAKSTKEGSVPGQTTKSPFPAKSTKTGPSGKSGQPTSFVSPGFSSHLPTSLRPTSIFPATTVQPGDVGSLKQQPGIDVVLISVLGGVFAFLIIGIAFFICGKRIRGKRESKQLMRKPTDQRPLTARSVSMMSDNSMYENGSVSAEDFTKIFGISNGELENGSIAGYSLSRPSVQRTQSVGQESIGASSTRMLLRQESEVTLPRSSNSHFDTIRVMEIPHALVGNSKETSTDKTLSLNKKKKNKNKKKKEAKQSSATSSINSSISSLKKGFNSKKKKKQNEDLPQKTEDDLDDNVFMNAAFVDSECSTFKRKSNEVNNNAKVLDSLPASSVDDIDIGPDGVSTPRSHRSSFHDDSLSPASENHSLNTSAVLQGLDSALKPYDSDNNSYGSSDIHSGKLPYSSTNSIHAGGYSTLPNTKSKSIIDPPAQFRDPEPNIAIVRPSSVKKSGEWQHQGNGYINRGHLRNSTPDLHAPIHNGVTRINVTDSNFVPRSGLMLNPSDLVVAYTSETPNSDVRMWTANGKPAAHVSPQVHSKIDTDPNLDAKPAPYDVKL